MQKVTRKLSDIHYQTVKFWPWQSYTKELEKNMECAAFLAWHRLIKGESMAKPFGLASLE